MTGTLCLFNSLLSSLAHMKWQPRMTGKRVPKTERYSKRIILLSDVAGLLDDHTV